MTTSKMEEDELRRQVLRDDLKAKVGSTYLDHTHSDLGGRFAQVGGAQTITGTTGAPNYPAASSAHQIQLPDEPALGYSIDQVERR
jgi:hypothetical protein